MPVSFQELINTVQFFKIQEIKILIYGGWALDLHAGRQTREHDDVDNFIPQALHSKFLKALHETKVRLLIEIINLSVTFNKQSH
mmetsp:Transcript_33440/g.48479  ORF Transcript_33440/g.48479 Transcript_33440/m.48479 type:complete len:84 (-) Transcript_33440:438-689(-)